MLSHCHRRYMVERTPDLATAGITANVAQQSVDNQTTSFSGFASLRDEFLGQLCELRTVRVIVNWGLRARCRTSHATHAPSQGTITSKPLFQWLWLDKQLAGEGYP